MNLSDPSLNKPLHTKYWLRCLRSHLPTAYTPTDAQRMTLAFFILSALDLLSALSTSTTPDERAAFVDWIYRCQHPEGGFRGSTCADTSSSSSSSSVEGSGEECGEGRGKSNKWDPANLASTYFALASLAVLGDDFGKVRRRECLAWVRGMQHSDGSFGEVMVDGEIKEGRDVRFCYCASVVRWILGGGRDGYGERDIDVEGLVGFVRASKTYDGGIAKSPFYEAHAGETYCGIATLALLGKLPRAYTKGGSSSKLKDGEEEGVSEEFIEETIRWLVYRQTSMVQEEEEEYTVGEDETGHQHQPPALHLPELSDIQAALPHLPEASHATPTTAHTALPTLHASFALPPTSHSAHQTPLQPILAPLTIPPSSLLLAGFNGRCNKVVDTCYSFWVGGTLSILNQSHLPCATANRRYLLERAQHAIGGFGKMAGDLPDILHSYLALAALATMGEPELKELDAMLCVSVGVRDSRENLRIGFGKM